MLIIGSAALFDGVHPPFKAFGLAIEADRIMAVDLYDTLTAAYPQAETEFYPDVAILPGLIDMHTHLTFPAQKSDYNTFLTVSDEQLIQNVICNAQAALRCGFTTLVDCGGKNDALFPARSLLQMMGEGIPDLLLCGCPLTIPHGHAWHMGGEVNTDDAIAEKIAELCNYGADFIKVMAGGGGTPDSIKRIPAYEDALFEKIVAYAHDNGKKVIGHVTDCFAVQQALCYGMDIIAHCQFFDRERSYVFEPKIIDQFCATGVTVNPTLYVNEVLKTADTAGMSATEIEKHKNWVAFYMQFEETTQSLYASGVPILCGSDAGWGDVAFTDGWREITALHTAGIPLLDCLKSSTSVNAKHLGLSGQVGTLAPGLKADFILTHKKVFDDLTHLQNVVSVYKNGRKLKV